MSAVRAVTFDAGQTLVELDTAMLARRLGERGVVVAPAALDAALPAAWRHHEQVVAAGGRHPWRELMTALLAGALAKAAGDALPGRVATVRPPERSIVAGDELAALVDWLWGEQPRANLWRRPIAGMRALVEELAAAGVPLAVVSNSEGRLAELLDELGWARWFRAIADSGALGVAKPDRGIFDWTAARLGVPGDAILHVGDSWEADVVGALAAGWRAAWFGPAARPVDDARVVACPDAAALRAALVTAGVG